MLRQILLRPIPLIYLLIVRFVRTCSVKIYRDFL
jgi:hypothetical protein